MKQILIILCLLWGTVQAQTIGYLRYDTVKMAKSGGTTELVLENATKAITGGVLTNTGNGRTAFVGPGGAWTPTWQQTLTAGRTLTTDNSVDANGNLFEIIQADYINFAAENNRVSNLVIYEDSIKLNPGLGNLKIDSLTSALGTKALRYNPTTGLVSYTDTTLGGGLTVGTTTIGSGTNTRVLYNNAGVLGEYTVTGTGTTAVLGTSPAITTSLTTPSTTFALLNTTATTVNAFGAATTTNLFSAASGGIFNLANTGIAAELRFLEPSAGGTAYVGFKAPAITTSTGYTLPTAFPAGTYLLQSTAAGVMSWLNPSTIVPTLISTDGSITITGNDIETRVYIDAGLYTPTITNGGNVAASTAYECQWSRVGGVVTVSGQIDIDATLTATVTDLTFTLPVASAFSAANEAGGTGFCISVAGLGFPIYADVPTGEAKIRFIVTDINNNTYPFSFTYSIK